MLMLILMLTIVLELALYVPLVWRARQIVAGGLIAGLSFMAGFILVSRFSLAAGLVVFVIAYRVVNLLRIIKARLHKDYLRRTALVTSLWLALGQILSGVLLVLVGIYEWWFAEIAIFSAVVQAGVLFGLLLVTARNLYKSRHISVSKYYSDQELPTLTVAVPARNETRDLTDCLDTILGSDYPKLEVLVYDDCSQIKISDIIKKYAHQGVRFIKGDQPNPNWLAKNYAYSQLAKHASGEYILFCGVDVRFGRSAIRSLVTTLLNRDKAMISVMPKRIFSAPAAAFVQPMRYWWELIPPRRWFNRPPVLSSCWLISQNQLNQLGGFKGVRRSILPESFLARELTKTDEYSFIRANNELDIQTVKKVAAQRHTAIRMRYPQVHRRPEMIAGLTLLHLGFLLSPFGLLAAGLLLDINLLTWLSGLSVAFILAIHLLIMYFSNPANVPLAVPTFPFVVLSEIGLSHESMLRYEFGDIEWKGRNVCIPVMQVIPKLPEP